MKFSVVIVNYASWPYTLRCIESLYGTGHVDFEVVVVDNDRRATVPALPSGTRLIRNPRNIGFAGACNLGIAASSGDVVVLVNPDVVVENHFFRSLQDFFDSTPKAGISGPRVLDGDGNLQLSARKELSLLSGLLGRTSVLTRLFPHSQAVRRMFPATDDHSGPSVVDWVSGACMGIRRKVLDEIGPMDERYFMYFEDADLCRRAREAGWLVYYLPAVEVSHQTGASTRSRPKAIWRLHKSAFLYHRKYGPHGPLQLYSLLVLVGLALRALTRLGVTTASDAWYARIVPYRKRRWAGQDRG